MENNKKIGRPTIGIVTDGLHIKKEKMTHYKAVDLATGEEIFNRTVGNQTTCIGRFIAIALDLSIYSDIAVPQSAQCSG